MSSFRIRALLAAASVVLIPGITACQGARAEEVTRVPAAESPVVLASDPGRDSVIFAGGCFWGVEAVFERVAGVIDATSGYAGGDFPNPSYELVSTGRTGYAESVKVVFDPSVVSYSQLLRVFFSVAHDPTQRNRQGPDVGPQYRSAIFTATRAQLEATERYVRQLTAANVFEKPIVTELSPWQTFHEAEAYHQGYYDAHPNSPYIVFNDKPKVAALERQFPDLYREK